jgi:hypothetical protein
MQGFYDAGFSLCHKAVNLLIRKTGEMNVS